MKFKKYLLTLGLVLSFALPLFAQEEELDKFSPKANRGNPWEYDAGPEKDSKWLEIFASTPNYRGIGRVVLDRERYRWHWGPIFYRGRLGKNEVKVLVIGQEGAQDEALSRHSFTGGTGQKMQHFLNHIGINRSYLFVNTFVYCIHGQYQDETIEGAIAGDYWMAQSPSSPIVQHRHKLFNTAAEINDLRLVVAVGSAAQDTVVTWVESRGGVCENRDNSETCDASVLGKNTKIIRVPHPGGAGQVPEEERAKTLENLRRKFQQATDRIAAWISEDPEWLPADEGAYRPRIAEQENGRGMTFTKPYVYRSAPVPYRDFAFGFNWRLGARGTSSNRGDGQRSVKVFSEAGEYADPTVRWAAPKRSGFKDSGYIQDDEDLAYEAPRHDTNAFDPGPGEKWARLLMGEEEGYEWPDFNALGVTSHKSFGTGPIYRGRLDNTKFLILADQESHDDMFTCRALTGNGGQKVQHFLTRIGAIHNYVIIRTLPVDTLDLSFDKVREISNHSQVVRVRNRILEKILEENSIELILTFGSHAKEAMRKCDTKDVTVVNLKSATEKGAAQDWNKGLKKLQKVRYMPDYNPQLSFRYSEKGFRNTRLEINRYDLPINTPRWFGTSGSLGSRALNNPEHYKLTMPEWADRLRAPKLSRSERNALESKEWLLESFTPKTPGFSPEENEEE
ncbi:MAG: hypothetical protein HYY61_00895 [Deltaproteobacteria bacterium]|nr:hypothetical protein [Deltaproteobacteria bacterium]